MRTTLPNLLPLEVQFGETERFSTLVRGHDLRLLQASAMLPTGAGLGLALADAAACATPWQPMPRPWLDPRLG